jgi:hypothetical protein
MTTYIESSDLSDTVPSDYCLREIIRPSEDSVNTFKSSHWTLTSSSTQIKGSGRKRSRYDINWCNIDDYVANWDLLTMDEKELLRSIIHSDLTSNFFRFGLKKKNLETHLLLSLGSDINNIIGKGDYITTLLKSVGGCYSTNCIDNRSLDPKTCLRAYNRFIKSYDIPSLFSSNHECYQAVVTPKEPYHVQSANISRLLFKNIFEENNKYFSDLTLKKKKISSYLCSHEISVDSIQAQLYRPHSHLIIFMKKGASKEENKIFLSILEEKFNLKYEDRTLEFLRKDDGSILKVTTYPAIEKSISYLFRSYSLADQYLMEVNETNINNLNRKTVETLHNLIDLFKSDTGTTKRICSGKLPKLLKIAKSKEVK